jgi:hypothetical protein
MRDCSLTAALALLLVAAPVAHAGAAHAGLAPTDTIYVDADATGTGDGSSWADAYTKLQDALQAARTNGQDDAVWVAAGTYYPDEGGSATDDDRTTSFEITSGIDLRGHFSGDEDSPEDRALGREAPKTILSGEIQQDANTTNNAYTVLHQTGGTVGEVHITRGTANGADGRGGGVRISGGTLHHAVLKNNRARRGAALSATGSPTLEVLLVTGNHATQAGALYFDGDATSAQHLTVADNTAEEGPNGFYFIDSDAAVNDFAIGPNTTNGVVTVTYTVEGDVSSSDGDTVTGVPVNLVSPSDDTVDTDNTDSNGFYQTSATEDELGGDQATLASNPAGYDQYTEDLALSEGTNTENVTLQEILRDYDFNTEDGDGDSLGDVTVDIDETTSGTRDITEVTTDDDGNASTTLSVDEQVLEGDELTFTADKDDYNSDTETDIVDTESETVTLTLQEQTTTYTVEGTLTDDDGDQLSDKDVLIQTPSDNTIATTTTNNSGSYNVSVTEDELGGDTGEVQSNPTGYNKVENTVTFQDGTNTVNLSLPLTEYQRTFDVDNANGDPVADASIDADETTNGDRDVFTATTNSSGEHTETLTIDDMIVDGDQLEYTVDKDGYNATTKTETVTDTTKTINATIDEENTTDRITITFNPKIVGDDLYSGGYGDAFDYTVSTDDTTFTTTGSTTADIPITDGDDLELSTSDSAYLNTVVANNTDTEQPPFQGSGFPDEPDYQNTTIAISKSDVVSEYQVAGFPETSPEGYDTIDDWKPHMEDSDVRRWTNLDGYSTLKTFIQEGHSDQWEDKADEVVPEVQGFMPIPIDGPTYITDSELQDVFDNRDENNITRFDEDASGTLHNYSGDYLQNSAGFFYEGDVLGTVRSEVYNAFTGLDDTDNHYVTEKVLDNSDEFIPSEAKFPIMVIYNTDSPTDIQ